ncbi:hypothetical protein AYI68_g625 [Smittium mucronatum]|uniref:Uncharacterized protein n=1 Tax=Smittium mucronatum TaxID=133383 RepID=A0A1R0H7S5_9FUNG|nr:hypothetical protein AYI68_g625 [Smittium mucronatum]
MSKFSITNSDINPWIVPKYQSYMRFEKCFEVNFYPLEVGDYLGVDRSDGSSLKSEPINTSNFGISSPEFDVGYFDSQPFKKPRAHAADLESPPFASRSNISSPSVVSSFSSSAKNYPGVESNKGIKNFEASGLSDKNKLSGQTKNRTINASDKHPHSIGKLDELDDPLFHINT